LHEREAFAFHSQPSRADGPFCAGVLLGLAAAAIAAPSPNAVDQPAAIRLEAETGQRSGRVAVATTARGFSGSGYVTVSGGCGPTDAAFAAHAGLYEIAFRYRSPIKGFLFDVNGLVLSGMFANSKGAFVEQRMGKVELREGENILAIHGGWKLYEIDRVDLTPTAIPSLRKPPATLCDSQSIPAARALMSYLVANYGERTLSGTIEGPDVATCAM